MKDIKDSMIRERELIRLVKPIGLICLIGLLLTGCSDDTEREGWQNVTFEAIPGATGFEEKGDESAIRPMGTIGVTRDGDPEPPTWTPPQSYYFYNDVVGLFPNQVNLFYKSIDVFFTRNDKEPLHGTFFYKKDKAEPEKGQWMLNMDIEETDDYYVYGYIPKEVASSASIGRNESYSEGAVLTLTGMKTITHSDVCVIVGAKEGENSYTATGLTTGQFVVNTNSMIKNADGTTSMEAGKHNYIYLLFDHLYSGIAFNFTIDADYDALRTIKVRKLELIGYSDAYGTKVKAKYDAIIELKAGASPIKKVTFNADPLSGDIDYEPIFTATGDGVELDPNVPSSFMGCFVPGQYEFFKLRTTYDVYDKKNNLIRKGCEAENAINLTDIDTSSFRRGKMFKIPLIVQPTYLYVLSDPDLDNPTITIN